MLCVQRQDPSATTTRGTGKVDISLLLKPQDEEQPSPQASSRSTSVPGPAMHQQMIPSAPPIHQGAPQQHLPQHYTHSHPQHHVHQRHMSGMPSAQPPTLPSKRPLAANPTESPAKKQSKWSAEEDALIIDLRGRSMKWEDISKRLPGRSAISCRLHYQNYLERRSEWDEDRKNKLARLYERFKPEMWAKVAEEMAIPWRAAEAMHWQLGEQEMARRAGVVPFSLTNANPEAMSRNRRGSATSAPRSRRESLTRPIPAQQLPSMAELTASIPAYSGPLPQQQQQKLQQQSPQAALPQHPVGPAAPVGHIMVSNPDPYAPRGSPQSIHHHHHRGYGAGPPAAPPAHGPARR